MVPNNYADFINSLTNLVNMNVIPMSRIDDAVRRILRVKFVMGLFENPLADLSLADQLGKKVLTSRALSLTPAAAPCALYTCMPLAWCKHITERKLT